MNISEVNIPKLDEEIKRKISMNLNGLNDQSKNYIKDVIKLVNREIGINKIISIILFGSQRTSQENTKFSDCDLLFIFKDRVSTGHIREIERYFIALEIKHKFRDPNDNLIHDMMSVLQHSTGMFISHFLTKKKFWDQVNFHRIFQVNRFFSTLFAPRNLVLANVLDNSTLLYGEDLRIPIKPKIKISIREIFRSLVMNLIISVFALFISPFKNLNPMKYQLESIKWSLRSSNYYCFEDSLNLNVVIDRFLSLEKEKKRRKAEAFFKRFVNLRFDPKNDVLFMKRCPLRIFKIHLKAIIYKNLFKNANIKITNELYDSFRDSRSIPL